MECVPGVNVDMFIEALPATILTADPNAEPPSKNVTVPVAEGGFKVAVSVTLLPWQEGLLFPVTVTCPNENVKASNVAQINPHFLKTSLSRE